MTQVKSLPTTIACLAAVTLLAVWTEPCWSQQLHTGSAADAEGVYTSLDPTAHDIIPPQLPATTFSFAYLAPGGDDGFGNIDFDLHRTWQLPLRSDLPPIDIAPGFGLHLWDGPKSIDLPPAVYDLYLDLSWRMIDGPCWGLTGGLTPGFYGDFERLDEKAFQFTSWLIADWTLNEHWTVLGGVAYVRQLQSNILPVGGVVWRPHDDLRLEFVIPRPRIACRFADDDRRAVWGFVSGVFGGGAWAVNDGNENVLVQYSDLRLSLGIEWIRHQGPSTIAEVGYVFAREISVDEMVLVEPTSTIFLQTGITF